jgi:hypothetical protein
VGRRAARQRGGAWLLGGLCLAALIGAAPAEGRFKISAPTLSPGFTARGHDYVVQCRRPVELTVRSERRGVARIGKRRFFSGRRSRTLRLREGQAIEVVRRRGGGRKQTYHVRCLPRDFPDYTYTRHRRSRIGPFIFAPISMDLEPNYAVVLDEFGAPIWWLNTGRMMIDPKVLDDGTIAAGYAYELGFGVDPRSRYVLFSPSGRSLGTLRTVGSPTDLHDLQRTRNGNFVLVSYRERSNPVDASWFNGDSSARVLDAVVQKLTPDGKLLWEWNSKDHIDLEETGRWWLRLADEPYDVVHINSLDLLPGGDYLVSMRHTDAVYRINGRTGKIKWKLGGQTTPESLEVRRDPLAAIPLGGQHDARLLKDGTVTIHDNGTELFRPPRAVRYRISSGKARLIDSVEDELVSDSACCGSARRVGGSWLLGWGGGRFTTEIDRRGRRAFELRVPDLTYRATPIDGAIGKRALRRGMNRRVPPKR